MSKKIIIGAIILLAIIGLAIFYLTKPSITPSPINDAQCSSDSDCKLIYSNCDCEAVSISDSRTSLDNTGLCKMNLCRAYNTNAICSRGLCVKSPDQTSNNSLPSADNIITANNQFAIDLYSKYSSKEENVFFSPYSLSSALAMTYEGARGQTAEEMQKVMHFPNDTSLMRSEFSSLYLTLNPSNSPYKLTTANALWAQRDFKFSQDYLNLVETNYYGKTTNLDFKDDTENSRITINNWVANKTNDKILDLIPSGTIGPDTRLVLTNAIYFLANWSQKFETDFTSEKDFNLSSGTSIKTQMMHQTSYFSYMENSNLKMLEMDYLGDDLSMLVLLPSNNNIDSLDNTLNLENLETWKKEMNNSEVEVSFPRFKFETKYMMASDLKQMGMPIAFTDSADFSGMTGKKDLQISEVIHQAFVNVSESGTEAAAATAVIMVSSAMPGEPRPRPKIFNANHPFIFLIQEKSTGTILFMGKVANPNI
jgi:serpin B